MVKFNVNKNAPVNGAFKLLSKSYLFIISAKYFTVRTN